MKIVPPVHFCSPSVLNASFSAQASSRLSIVAGRPRFCQQVERRSGPTVSQIHSMIARSSWLTTIIGRGSDGPESAGRRVQSVVCGCQTFDDVPPNGFASAQNSGEFCALRFGILPEISRVAVPQKRQNSKPTVPDCNQSNGNRRSQRGGAAIKTDITTESRRHGEERRFFYQEAMKPGKEEF